MRKKPESFRNYRQFKTSYLFLIQTISSLLDYWFQTGENSESFDIIFVEISIQFQIVIRNERFIEFSKNNVEFLKTLLQNSNPLKNSKRRLWQKWCMHFHRHF